MQHSFVQYEKVSYDPEGDILYIVKQQGTYNESDKQGDIITNFDAQGNILSREIFHPKKNEDLVRSLLYNSAVAVWV